MQFKLNTHIFKLSSGIECEISELTGVQQEILTKQDGKKFEEKLALMLQSILIRIGTMTDISLDFIQKTLLAADKKNILIEARNFSLGFQDSFVYPFEYKDRNNKDQREDVEILLVDKSFPVTPLKKEIEEDGKKVLVVADYKEYSEIQRKRKIILPRTELEVEITLLDGNGESVGAAKKKSERSSHMAIEMRNPVYFEKKEDKTPVAISLSNILSKLPLQDIEELRTQIKAWEGDVNSEITFEHPDADYLPPSEKQVKVNVLNTLVFLLPIGSDLEFDYCTLTYSDGLNFGWDEYMRIPYERRVKFLDWIAKQRDKEEAAIEEAKQNANGS